MSIKKYFVEFICFICSPRKILKSFTSIIIPYIYIYIYIETQFLLSSSRVDIAIWMHNMDAN